jgi:hypothetical protein
MPDVTGTAGVRSESGPLARASRRDVVGEWTVGEGQLPSPPFMVSPGIRDNSSNS